MEQPWSEKWPGRVRCVGDVTGWDDRCLSPASVLLTFRAPVKWETSVVTTYPFCVRCAHKRARPPYFSHRKWRWIA